MGAIVLEKIGEGTVSLYLGEEGKVRRRGRALQAKRKALISRGGEKYARELEEDQAQHRRKKEELTLLRKREKKSLWKRGDYLRPKKGRGYREGETLSRRESPNKTLKEEIR